jgi:hypothetical protein
MWNEHVHDLLDTYAVAPFALALQRQRYHPDIELENSVVRENE